jgi:hypothetical protein
MRLIDVDTLEIKAFSEQDVPGYAILSHTWGPDEVTFQEMSLITRMRSVSQTFGSQIADDSQGGGVNGIYGSDAMMVAMEMLVHGGWRAGTNVPNTTEDALMARAGYRKIIQSAREAKSLGYQWVWIDVSLPPLTQQDLCKADYGNSHRHVASTKLRVQNFKSQSTPCISGTKSRRSVWFI